MPELVTMSSKFIGVDQDSLRVVWNQFVPWILSGKVAAIRDFQVGLCPQAVIGQLVRLVLIMRH